MNWRRIRISLVWAMWAMCAIAFIAAALGYAEGAARWLLVAVTVLAIGVAVAFASYGFAVGVERWWGWITDADHNTNEKG